MHEIFENFISHTLVKSFIRTAQACKACLFRYIFSFVRLSKPLPENRPTASELAQKAFLKEQNDPKSAKNESLNQASAIDPVPRRPNGDQGTAVLGEDLKVEDRSTNVHRSWRWSRSTNILRYPIGPPTGGPTWSNKKWKRDDWRTEDEKRNSMKILTKR